MSAKSGWLGQQRQHPSRRPYTRLVGAPASALGGRAVEATATLLRMGSRGRKPRKPKHSQHLPKVGTATENRLEQREEREAVLDNLGLGGIPSWVKLTLGVIATLVVIGAVVALVALN